MSETRMGVWVCRCRGEISRTVDTSALEAMARNMEHVCAVHTVDALCESTSVAELSEHLRAEKVNRLLFAGCSARSSLKFPEERFGEAMAKAGLDPAFLEVANIREQCAWLHKDAPAQASAKARDELAMAHARLSHAEPSEAPVAIQPRALVVGGGAAGLHASHTLANAGQKVTLVEQNSYLGGRLCQVGILFQSESWPSFCRSECVGPVQARDVVLHRSITAHTQSRVVKIDKQKGNFHAQIEVGAVFVNPDRCTSCGACAAVCPESIASPFEQGLFQRKAIDKEFERAVPDVYTLIPEACTRCGACVEACPADAIDLDAKPTLREEDYGAVFLATGFEQRALDDLPHLGSECTDVIQGLEFERLMDHGMHTPSDGGDCERFVFVLCAGSRATGERMGQGVPYCSKTCCSITVKQADRLLAANALAEVIIVHHGDIRTYERALEGNYAKLQAMGVEFIQAEVEEISQPDGGRVRVKLDVAEGQDPYIEEEEMQDGKLDFEADLVVLASAQTPHAKSHDILDQLGVLKDAHGFPRENQIRLFRPTESMVDRVFAIGSAVGPKVVQQAVEQGLAATARALPVLLAGQKQPGRYISKIARTECGRCGACLSVCPHGAISMLEDGAYSDPAFCQGCGFCAAACPTHAVQITNFNDRQILAQAQVAFHHVQPDAPKILALLCYWCSYSGGDLAGVKGLTAPANFRSIRIRCSSSVNSGLIAELFRMGIDGIVVAGCPEKSCHHAWGNYVADRRIDAMRRLMDQMGIDMERLKFEYIGVPQSQLFVDTITRMDRQLRAMRTTVAPGG